MTATIEQTAADTAAKPAEEAAQAAVQAAVHQTFTVGTVTIEAASEEEALRKYKRLVRSEALKAQKEMDWCNGGTNDRLRILGLREVGTGIPMRVTVTATRTAYISLDADTQDEAKELVAEGGADVLTLATASIGQQWQVTGIAAVDGELVDTTIRRETDQPDDTLSGLSGRGEVPGLAYCNEYRAGYNCTLPHGHGGPQHAAGNTRRIVHVWNRRD